MLAMLVFQRTLLSSATFADLITLSRTPARKLPGFWWPREMVAFSSVRVLLSGTRPAT